MKTIKINTYLPIFKGFYGSIFEPDMAEEQELEYINEQREEKGLKPIVWDEMDVNYKQYYLDCSKAITNSIERRMKDEFFSDSFKMDFEGLHSPKEYNFTNDSINVEIQTSKEDYKKVIEYLEENKETFAAYLKDNYTSYDGFISSWSNDVDEWIEMVKDKVCLSHVFGSVLDFIFKDEITEEAIADDICSEVNI